MMIWLMSPNLGAIEAREVAEDALLRLEARARRARGTLLQCRA
jgi:hypothetical protein